VDVEKLLSFNSILRLFKRQLKKLSLFLWLFPDKVFIHNGFYAKDTKVAAKDHERVF